MKTLENEQPDDGLSSQKAKISFPEEIIEQILSRLPVKSILRFKSVCKPWLSLISNPSFTKLHSTVGPRTTSLFFSAYDTSTNTRCFFSGANLIKLYKTPYRVSVTSEHLNGLVFFTNFDDVFGKIYVYVVNPTTRKFFKLPQPPVPGKVKNMRYLFGFDEASKEHKVVYIDAELIKLDTIEVMIFSMKTSSWKMITVDLPIDMNGNRWWCGNKRSICVNSTIHLMLRYPLKLLAFDLRTETFSIVEIHPDAVPQTRSGDARFVKVNDLLGVSCVNPVERSKKLHIWILQDYENRVWVRETIRFPRNSYEAADPRLFDSINMDEIIFCPRVLSENLISVPVYNIKSRCFKSIELTLRHRFLRPESVHMVHFKFYVESLFPLQN